MSVSTLSYYASHGPVTDPLDHASLFDCLPTGIGALRDTLQGVMLHIFWAERMGEPLTPERLAAVDQRSVPQKLAMLRAGSDGQGVLSDPRPLSSRLVGNCRDFATLLTSILRHRGIPARARCGFATYFLPDHFEDHWVCECWDGERWDGERWKLVDAQLDALQREALSITFDPLDVPRCQFVTGGGAWQMCRQGKAQPGAFGIFDMSGWAFVRGNLIRDFMALNKVELLPWDAWGYMTMTDEEAATLDLQKMDTLADLCVNVDTRFDEMRREAEDDPCLRIPDGWYPAQPPAWSPF